MVTISLRPSPAGNWKIRRCGVTLFSGLSLTQAIGLARDVARDEHLRLQQPTCVDMPAEHSTIELTGYANAGDECADEALLA